MLWRAKYLGCFATLSFHGVRWMNAKVFSNASQLEEGLQVSHALQRYAHDNL